LKTKKEEKNMKDKIREKEESTWIKKPCFQLKTKKEEKERMPLRIRSRKEYGILEFCVV